MASETVLNIEIASASGMLIGRLEGSGKPNYQHVYRAGAGVCWDNDAGAFKFDTKVDNRVAHWFAHIREVLEDEMDLRLRVDSTTTWTNVPNEVRRKIELSG